MEGRFGTGRSVARRELVAQLAEPLRRFLRTETGSAGLLLLATLTALAWANSPIGGTYVDVWSTELGVEVGSFELRDDLRHWINDGLMVFFFFVIGLEVRRELSLGELTDRRRVTVPVIAAFAGLALPALIYLGLNPSGEAARGWGVVMATDTAFLLGALALVGRGCPTQLRVFLLSLAVVDDVGALAAIAIFYSEGVSLPALAVAAGCVLAIFALGRLRVWRGPAYFAVGAALWVAMVESGVHPTIGGVVVGLLISAYAPRQEEVRRAGALGRAFSQSPLPELGRSAKLSFERAVSPNERLQELLHPWTSFAVVPVFALANAGVAVDRELVERSIRSPITLGIVAGLVVGKLVGIGLASTLSVRLGLGRLPRGVGFTQLWAGAALAGIGFTISLFVVDLAFDSEALQDEAKVGVLCASLLALLGGATIFQVGKLLTRGARPAPRMVLDSPVDPARDHIVGPADAPLTLVEYGDFECPFCGRATGAVEALRERFGDELRYVFRHLPLSDVHPNAALAAEAAEAAGAQGAFWEMHDRLFEHQADLEPGDLLGYAAEIGLDVERFTRELGAAVYGPRVRDDVASAEASGADGTPTFFVNGRRHVGPYDADALAAELTAERPDLRARAAAAPARGVELTVPAFGPRGTSDVPRAELDLDRLEETPDTDGALPRLSPAQVAMLERYGQRRRVERGERVYREGDPAPDFIVVLEGSVAIVEGYGTENRVVVVQGPRRFLGELSVLSGQAALMTAVAARDVELLVVPAARLRDALAVDPTVRDLVLRAFLLRRSLLLGLAAELRIVGSGSSPDTQRLRDYAARNGVRHVWIDLDSDERAASMLEELGVEPGETPVVVARDGAVLRNPSEDELGRALRAG